MSALRLRRRRSPKPDTTRRPQHVPVAPGAAARAGRIIGTLEDRAAALPYPQWDADDEWPSPGPGQLPASPALLEPAAAAEEAPRIPFARLAVALTICLVISLAGLGALGSFTTVRDEAYPWFGGLAWIVPVGIDAGIAACLLTDLGQQFLASKNLMDRGLPWVRWVAWLFIAATVYLNVSAADGNPVGIVMHAAMPGLFVVMIEAIRASIWRRARLVRRQNAPAHARARWPEARWLLLFGWRAFALWRRSQEQEMLGAYKPGLAMERLRYDGIASAKDSGWPTRRRAVRAHVAAAFLPPSPAGRTDLAQLTDAVNEVGGPAGQMDGPASGASRPRRPASSSPGAARKPVRPHAARQLEDEDPATMTQRALADDVAAALARKDFAAIRAQLTGRPDLGEFANWLAVATPYSWKRMLAFTGLAALGWDAGPAAVAEWISGPVPDRASHPDRKEISRMAQAVQQENLPVANPELSHAAIANDDQESAA